MIRVLWLHYYDYVRVQNFLLSCYFIIELCFYVLSKVTCRKDISCVVSRADSPATIRPDRIQCSGSWWLYTQCWWVDCWDLYWWTTTSCRSGGNTFLITTSVPRPATAAASCVWQLFLQMSRSFKLHSHSNPPLCACSYFVQALFEMFLLEQWSGSARQSLIMLLLSRVCLGW